LCQGAAARLSGTFGAEQKAAIRTAFMASGMPYADDSWRSVERALDRWKSAFIAMHTDACEATRLRGGQSEELLDLRMSCLEERRREAAELIQLSTTADAKLVENAVQAVSALRSLETCADAKALLSRTAPPEAHKRAQVDAQNGQLEEARALYDA